MNYTDICNNLQTLSVFKHIGEDKVITSLIKTLSANGITAAKSYSEMVGYLYESGGCLTDYIVDAVCNDENIYIKMCSAGKTPPKVIADCVEHELVTIDAVSKISSEDLKSSISYSGYLPNYTVSDISVSDEYLSRSKVADKFGYGIFARNRAFLLEDHKIVPVKSPDKITIEELSGYEYERQQIIANTRALVEGKTAANTLLYGDAGTGKSSTVKAVANMFKDNGLRLIELKKKQLHLIPELIDELSQNPLKFILFIDDLSFTKNDDDFAALKATLEGSVSARTSNIAIYATSNRRHLIQENFSDRNGDDVHYNDTVQELVSLSSRFGLTVTFVRPDKKLYNKITEDLARQYQITMELDELLLKANSFALSHGGYSPRTSKQFIESLAAMK